MAEAGVEVHVLVNGVEMEPGAVNFWRRSQTLSAVFQGLLTNEDGTACLSADPETGIIAIDEECREFEEIQLILDTMNANAFNFVRRDLPQGDYDIAVEYRIAGSSSKGNGSASATATIGKGSAIAEEIRFAKTN